MPMTRRALMTGIGAAAAACALRAASAQETYPPKGATIRVVVPFAPGGASDIVGRLLADYLSRRWSVPAVLENVAGGGTTVGIGRVASGPNDGTQVLILPLPYVTNQFLMARMPYDPQQDIAPVVQLTRQPSILCVTNGLPVQSVADLIAHAKANPGKLNYASSGTGSPGHLAAELLKSMSGVDMKHIPYTGSAPAQNALVGGHVDVFIDNAAAIIGIVRANSVRALAVTTPARSTLLPEFPAISETVQGFAMTGWLGVAVRGGTPEGIRNEIRIACNDCLNEKATRERLEGVIAEPVGGTTEQFAQFLGAERTRWGALIKTLSILP